ncbi:MAG: LamG-like jellyroll fold domain-containing protein [Planctomycetota bacterium]
MSCIKTYCARLIICLALLASFSAYALGATLTFQCDVNHGKEVLLPQVELFADSNGNAVFESDLVFWLSPVGAPMIPWHQWVVLLPPDADLDHVSCRLGAAVFEPAGTFNVLPAPPPGTWNEQGEPVTAWPENRNFEDGQDVDLYGRNAFWPAMPAQVQMTGRMSDWRLAEIAVPLFRYNPVRKTVERLVSADVIVDFSEPAGGRKAQPLSRKGEAKVRALAINFDSAASAYETPHIKGQGKERIKIKPALQNTKPLSGAGYAIITTSAIRDASTKLADFMAHKTALGFNVILTTEAEWGGGVGDAAAINVRAWLQANYITDDLSYVLIIGNPHPDSGDVPMKMCSGDQPTDYFFAELTAEWDKDGDGIYGEYGPGASQGSETDKYFEVFTGRIPYYGNMADTDSILNKIITYENSTDTDWRRNALLPMVPLDESTPSYQMGEQIKGNFCEPQGVPSDRIYDEPYGLLPPPEYLRSEAYPATVWSQGQYGMIVWMTHGWPQGASGVIDINDVANLDDTHPAVTWHGSCSNSEPEASNNIAYSLLTHGAIATLGATRVSWYWVGQSNFTNSNSIGGMGYQFAKRLMDEQACGQAMWEMKEALDFWLENYYVFNLYGDPSVVVIPPKPAFTVSPTDLFYSFRVEEGQFYSKERTYTLNNNDSQPIDWTVSASESWVEFAKAGGSIPGDDKVTMDVILGLDAALLAPGIHTATLTFTDTTNAKAMNREVSLEVVPRRLTCHWKLDEKVGELSIDASHLANHGTLLGGGTFDTCSVPGRWNDAVMFDGLDDCVETPALNIQSNSLTITAWVKPEDIQTTWTGLVVNRGGGSYAGLIVHNNNMLNMYWGSGIPIQDGIELPVGQWSFVAMTVEPDKAVIYLSDENGDFQRQTRNGTFAMQSFKDSFYIGSNSMNNNRYFHGVIDDVRIYNYSMDGHAIKDIFAGGVADNPCPLNHAAGVESRILRWNPGVGALASDVYLGRNANKVKYATQGTREFKGTINGNVHLCENLLPDTEYYWRIDSETATGTLKGRVWQFTTASVLHSFDLRTGLMTHLTMDDAHISGDLIYDTSGMPVYDGTLFGATPSQAGPVREALEFDGVDDYVSIPQMDLNSNSVTMSVWIRPVKLNNTYTGIAFCSGNGTAAGLMFYQNNRLAYRWDGSYNKWNSGLIVPVNQWSHVALAVAPDKATLFLNGVAVENKAPHGVEPFSEIIRLANYGTNSARRFEGRIDDFFLWNRTLTEEDILILYHGGLKGMTME